MTTDQALAELAQEYRERSAKYVDPLGRAIYAVVADELDALASREPAVSPKAASKAEPPTIPSWLWDWLEARGIAPEPSEDGQVITEEVIEALDRHEAELLATPQPKAAPGAVEVVLEGTTETFVQEVPNKCDRIIWRGHYYHLPILASQSVAVDLEQFRRAVEVYRGCYDYDRDGRKYKLAEREAEADRLLALIDSAGTTESKP